jgi:hypothetical protein
MIVGAMKATLTIDDEVFHAAQKIAVARSVAVDTVISELARRGLESEVVLESEGGLPVFRVPAGVKPVTNQDVRKAEDEW